MSISITFEEFEILLKDQLENSNIPRKYWRVLYDKLNTEVFDAGESFMIQRVVYETESDDAEPSQNTTENGEQDDNYAWKVVVNCKDGISTDDPKHIYLIDHAWTYRVEHARGQLRDSGNGLLERMMALMDLSESESREENVQKVMDNMWKYNQTYNIGNLQMDSEEAQPIWYIMDEFGSRIQHPGEDEEASVKVVPLFYPPMGCAFSVMWPLKDIQDGEEVTRNYVELCTSDIKNLRMYPWLPDDYSHRSYELPPASQTLQQKYRIKESLPNESCDVAPLPTDRPIRVFFNLELYREHFKADDTFTMVDDTSCADILWLQTAFKDFKSLSEECQQQYISQFPNESLLVVKDLFAIMARSAAGSSDLFIPETLETRPAWLQTTFDLLTELPQFVSFFQNREKRGLDNTWIIKPWNLNRTLDIQVTNNLDHIIRVPDTGPRIISKYIEDPVLYDLDGVGKVKFDLRIVVLLKSVRPLTAYLHKLITPRFAEKAFSLDEPDDMDAHLSVLSYRKGFENIRKVPMETFAERLEKQYPGNSWQKIEDAICACMKECLETVTAHPPPLGLAHSPQSRAMYGVDVMLKWATNDNGDAIMQPVILEFNLNADIRRHFEYQPDIFSDILHTLYTGNTEGRPVRLL